MNKKLFLTSAIAIGFVANAYAEPANTGEFPQDGLMQEDYTYTNAATSTNMDGVYEGTVNATAEYENILYQLAAGQYLPANSETPIDCDQNGYYCGGDSNGVNYSNVAQGLTQCPSGYANSDAGAQSSDQCYRSCSGNVTIQHATAVTGFDYYGNGVDTCAPTSCENGWHVRAATPDLTTTIGVTDAGTGYTSNDYTGNDYDTDNMSNTIIANDPMGFAVDYGNNGMIKGHGRCSTTPGSNGWYTNGAYDNNGDWSNTTTTNSLTDETDPTNGGQYCYCQLDSYTPLNGNAIALSAPWVFHDDYGVAGLCANDCALNCAGDLRNDGAYSLAFRAPVFGSITPSPAQCSANTITINWLDVDQQYAGQNNEGTAVYGGNINTPFKAATKPGQRFTGWRFSTPTPVSVGD